MAITRYCYQFWKEIRDDGWIPEKPYVLELGQANWYGDLDPKCLEADVHKYAKESDVPKLLNRFKEPGTPDEPILFIYADVFYRAIFWPVGIAAVDMNGTAKVGRFDLNYPIGIVNQDIVINTGTAEHIFNQYQFFKTAHDACARDGIMVHMLPAWGWLDHGFYNYHPTFVADLAAANGYEIVKWWMYDLGENWYRVVRLRNDPHAIAMEMGTKGSAMHAVCYRKTADSPFQMPIQGHYAGTLEPDLETAWLRDR